MADSQLIINANRNSQRAVETSNKAFDCAKELAVVQGQHVLTISALARALFEAEVQIVEMRELLGLPLNPHMQEIRRVSLTLRAESEAAMRAVQAEIAAYEGSEPTQLPLRLLPSGEGAEDPRDLTSGE
jgi:hypothetical protein